MDRAVITLLLPHQLGVPVGDRAVAIIPEAQRGPGLYLTIMASAGAWDSGKGSAVA